VLARLDADDDGLLTPQELRLLPSEAARFTAADHDTGDGWLTVAEFAKVCIFLTSKKSAQLFISPSASQFLFPSFDSHMHRWLSEFLLGVLDIDHDGAVTLAEFTPTNGAEATAVFASLDHDHDGLLDQWDLVALVRLQQHKVFFATVDAFVAAADDSGDGTLTIAEVEAHAPVFVGTGSVTLPWPDRPLFVDGSALATQPAANQWLGCAAFSKTRT
jgi:hypothetical protein